MELGSVRRTKGFPSYPKATELTLKILVNTPRGISQGVPQRSLSVTQTCSIERKTGCSQLKGPTNDFLISGSVALCYGLRFM